MCDLGGMIVQDYAFLIGLLAIICGLVFCLGLHQ
jgi:hypothetical protein